MLIQNGGTLTRISWKILGHSSTKDLTIELLWLKTSSWAWSRIYRYLWTWSFNYTNNRKFKKKGEEEVKKKTTNNFLIKFFIFFWSSSFFMLKISSFSLSSKNVVFVIFRPHSRYTFLRQLNFCVSIFIGEILVFLFPEFCNFHVHFFYL